MRKKGTVFTVLLIVMFFLVPPTFVSADDGEKVGFSVQAHLPENQRDHMVTYFDLRVEPGQTQDLAITVYNHEDEDITVRSDIYNASTNRNGLVIYDSEEEIDPSLEVPVTDIVTLEKNQWDIPAGSSRTVTAVLEAPEQPFDGIKLGGIHFEKVTEEDDDEEGISIQNRYAYVIGLQLSVNDEPVDPKLALQSVAPGLVNYRTAVVAKIQNSQPMLMNDLTIEAKVYEENGEDPLQTAKQEGVRMAPNSAMDFVIDWDNQPLAEGNYRVEVSAADEDNKWEWQETFAIAEEDEDLNEQAVELDTTSQRRTWYILGIGILLAVIIGLIIYIYKLKKATNN